jgi:hypothetical protein
LSFGAYCFAAKKTNGKVPQFKNVDHKNEMLLYINAVINDAKQRRLFPPVLQMPEDSRGGYVNVVTALFSALPYVVWLPELCLEGDRPRWLRPECTCAPTPNKYISREVHGVGHITRLCFIEYRCVKNAKTPKIFNTISDEFLKNLPSDVASLFPYVQYITQYMKKHE